VRGAAGGLLAQAAQIIRQAARSDIFNMAVSPRLSSLASTRNCRSRAPLFGLWRGHGRR